MKKQDQRTAIIDAAERVLVREGLAHVTMDAMASEAGITKGGLFYHFASKQEILLAILDRFEERLLKLRERHLDTDPREPGRRFKATILALIEYLDLSRQRPANIGGVYDNPEMRAKLANLKQRIFDTAVQSGGKPEKVALALVLVDGLWVNSMFDKDLYYSGYVDALQNWLITFADSVCEP